LGYEDVDQIEDVEVALEIDRRHISVEQQRETNRPHSRSVPPVPKSVFHYDKAASLIGELFDIM
jgi:hypothetical protein